MARDSGQKFIRSNRPPRVHITYENPANAEEKVEIPFVMGVMSDLSGNTPGVEKEEIDERKFLDFDMDNFDARMAAIQPGVSFRVENKLSENADEKMGVSCASTRWRTSSRRRLPARCRRWPSCWRRAAACQSDALHGRQGRGRRIAAQVAGRSAADGRAEEPRRRKAATRRRQCLNSNHNRRESTWQRRPQQHQAPQEAPVETRDADEFSHC